MPPTPRVLTPSTSRTEHVQRIRRLTDSIAACSKAIFGVELLPAFGFELEFVAKENNATANARLVIGEDSRVQFTDEAGEKITPFDNSPYIMRVVPEVKLPGAPGEMVDGDHGRQFEIVGKYSTNQLKAGVSEQAPSNTTDRVIGPSQIARVLEILPKLLQEKTRASSTDSNHALNFEAIPFKSERDQTSALQMNISLLKRNEDGTYTNFFDNGEGYENTLLKAVLEASLAFDKEGFWLYVPTEEDFKRFKGFASPQAHGVCYKREEGKMLSHMVRGPRYNAAREEDDRQEKKVDKGGVRIEHRLAPSSLLLRNDEFAYLYVESFLLKILDGLERYQHIDGEKIPTSLPPQSLASTVEEIDHNQLPHTLEEAKKTFSDSAHLRSLYGAERFEKVLGLLDSNKAFRAEIANPTLR